MCWYLHSMLYYIYMEMQSRQLYIVRLANRLVAVQYGPASGDPSTIGRCPVISLDNNVSGRGGSVFTVSSSWNTCMGCVSSLVACPSNLVACSWYRY
jgi:NAD-dependent dihydropyrimidine dehydrogenase PreA subunit